MCAHEPSPPSTLTTISRTIYPGDEQWLQHLRNSLPVDMGYFPHTGAYLDPGDPSSILHHIRSTLSRILGAVKSLLDPSQFD